MNSSQDKLFACLLKVLLTERAITRTRRLLESRLGDQVLIRLQDAIVLDDYSEPEPDIAVVVLDPLDYEDPHPTVSGVFLIIEIADSSLQYDCQVKAPVYAQSGIRDYWVLDLTYSPPYKGGDSKLEQQLQLKSVKESPPPLLSKTERDSFPIIPLLSKTAVVISTSLPTCRESRPKSLLPLVA